MGLEWNTKWPQTPNEHEYSEWNHQIKFAVKMNMMRESNTTWRRGLIEKDKMDPDANQSGSSKVKTMCSSANRLL